MMRRPALILLFLLGCGEDGAPPMGGGGGGGGGDANPQAQASFDERCAAAGVVRCFSFDSPAETDEHVDPPWGETEKQGEVVGDLVASGAGSLRFTIPSLSPSDSSGSFWLEFADDLSVQFGEGEEFYVQWRQRFSPEFLTTHYAGAKGWKQVIIGEGSRPGQPASSCTDLEVVTGNGYHRGFPTVYHSCGAKDEQYEGLEEPVPPYDFLLQNGIRDPGCLYSLSNAESYVPPCFGYEPNQWMTFQVHIAVGTFYQNDGHYRHDSTVQLWVAREGEPSTLAIDFSPRDPACAAMQTSLPACQTGYDLTNHGIAEARYGKVWLLPYNTDKDPEVAQPEAFTWYDELVISRERIADPR